MSWTVCMVAALLGTFDYIDLPVWATLALSEPNKPEKFPGQVMDLLQYLMPEGETYQDLPTAADIWGRHGAESLYDDPLNAQPKRKLYFREIKCYNHEATGVHT